MGGVAAFFHRRLSAGAAAVEAGVTRLDQRCLISDRMEAVGDAAQTRLDSVDADARVISAWERTADALERMVRSACGRLGILGGEETREGVRGNVVTLNSSSRSPLDNFFQGTSAA